ncbi:MAG: hypothetical protein HIU81_12660, partial [Acidobacteria bacterium]|nr:hypothetical protein [Acidobacteriota bacterium]
TSAVVPFTLLVPPVGIVAAALAFHEVPTVTELSGGALLLLGVAAAVVRLPTWRRRSLTDAALVRHEPPAELPAELAVGATADSRASRS